CVLRPRRCADLRTMRVPSSRLRPIRCRPVANALRRPEPTGVPVASPGDLAVGTTARVRPGGERFAPARAPSLPGEPIGWQALLERARTPGPASARSEHDQAAAEGASAS